MFQSKDYIYEIYRCGSFSAAARNLYITQPAISKEIKKEEERLEQISNDEFALYGYIRKTSNL